MRSLFILLIYISLASILFGATQSIISEDGADCAQSWIESLLDDKDKNLDGADYLFFCSGHHGIIWSIIASDSSRTHLYNGTTRKYMEHEYHDSFDTIAFINNNIKTINWGIDSLANATKDLAQLNDGSYNPIHYALYIIHYKK